MWIQPPTAQKYSEENFQKAKLEFATESTTVNESARMK
jgi:hypothetical protein